MPASSHGRTPTPEGEGGSGSATYTVNGVHLARNDWDVGEWAIEIGDDKSRISVPSFRPFTMCDI